MSPTLFVYAEPGRDPGYFPADNYASVHQAKEATHLFPFRNDDPKSVNWAVGTARAVALTLNVPKVCFWRRVEQFLDAHPIVGEPFEHLRSTDTDTAKAA